MRRIKPEGKLLTELIKLWKEGDHEAKRELARKCDVSYQTLANWACQDELPPIYEPPTDMTWQERLQVLKDINRATDVHHDIPRRMSITIDTDKPIGICFFADGQLGEPGVDYDSFERDVNVLVSTDGMKTAAGGDGYSNIIQPAKIGSSHNQAPICIQKAFYYQTIERLARADKLLFIGTGNHNWFSYLVDGEDWDLELSKRLNVVYTKHGAMVYLRVGEMVYPIFRQHKGRWNSQMNLTSSCKQYQRYHFPDARILVIEHDHVADVEQYTYNAKECVAIRTGTYAVRSDFAQSNGFYGSKVENPVIVLYPYEDRIVPFKSMYDGIEFLRNARRE